MKCLIIIPAYNEAENIERVVDNLIENYPQYDYVIVNDGSRDNTEEICKVKEYHVLHLPVNLGIGGAVQTGYRYAQKNDYDVAVQMDGDGQHDPAYLAKMLELIESENSEVVIGSRFVDKEGFQSSEMRRVGIRLLSVLDWVLTGIHVKDVTSGYRAVNKRFIKIFAEDYPADYPEPEALVIAAVYRGKVTECPVIMREREKGTSSINLKRAVYYMIKVSLSMMVRRLSFGVRREK